LPSPVLAISDELILLTGFGGGKEIGKLFLLKEISELLTTSGRGLKFISIKPASNLILLLRKMSHR
jgi:hypothetical protein